MGQANERVSDSIARVQNEGLTPQQNIGRSLPDDYPELAKDNPHMEDTVVKEEDNAPDWGD